MPQEPYARPSPSTGKFLDLCTIFVQFVRIDSQIRANRFRVPELNPLFCESRFRGLKIANRRFEAIRANRSHVMKIRVLAGA